MSKFAYKFNDAAYDYDTLNEVASLSPDDNNLELRASYGDWKAFEVLEYLGAKKLLETEGLFNKIAEQAGINLEELNKKDPEAIVALQIHITSNLGEDFQRYRHGKITLDKVDREAAIKSAVATAKTFEHEYFAKKEKETRTKEAEKTLKDAIKGFEKRDIIKGFNHYIDGNTPSSLAKENIQGSDAYKNFIAGSGSLEELNKQITRAFTKVTDRIKFEQLKEQRKAIAEDYLLNKTDVLKVLAQELNIPQDPANKEFQNLQRNLLHALEKDPNYKKFINNFGKETVPVETLVLRLDNIRQYAFEEAVTYKIHDALSKNSVGYAYDLYEVAKSFSKKIIETHDKQSSKSINASVQTVVEDMVAIQKTINKTFDTDDRSAKSLANKVVTKMMLDGNNSAADIIKHFDKVEEFILKHREKNTPEESALLSMVNTMNPGAIKHYAGQLDKIIAKEKEAEALKPTLEKQKSTHKETTTTKLAPPTRKAPAAPKLDKQESVHKETTTTKPAPPTRKAPAAPKSEKQESTHKETATSKQSSVTSEPKPTTHAKKSTSIHQQTPKKVSTPNIPTPLQQHAQSLRPESQAMKAQEAQVQAMKAQEAQETAALSSVVSQLETLTKDKDIAAGIGKKNMKHFQEQVKEMRENASSKDDLEFRKFKMQSQLENLSNWCNEKNNNSKGWSKVKDGISNAVSKVAKALGVSYKSRQETRAEAYNKLNTINANRKRSDSLSR